MSDNLPDDLKQQIEELLMVRVRDLQLPQGIADLFQLRSTKIRRALISGLFVWVGAITLILGFFDFFELPPDKLVPILAIRSFFSITCFCGSLLLRQGYFKDREQWVVSAAPLLALICASYAGYLSGQPDIAADYLLNGLFVIYSVIMFVNIDLRYTKIFALLAILLTAISMTINGVGALATRLQLFSLYAATTWALVEARQIQNRFQHRLFLINLRDEINVKEASNRNSELSSMAYRDRLTDIPNRRYFDELCATMSETTKNLIPLSVCMIDIDKFKSLNDQLGHLRGDHCLRVVADTIRHNLRGKTDILVRYGGDEFFLILPGTGMQRAVEVAERILGAITDLQHENPGSPFGIITASIGVYTHLAHPISGDILIENADAALYRAKNAGRNRVSV